VTKPEPHPTPTDILVASDFTDVSDKALGLALRIGSSRGSKVHLIHVFRSPFARLSEAEEAEARGEQLLHEQHVAASRGRLEEQLARVSGGTGLTNVSIAEVTYLADDAIARYVKTHHIDLLAVGSSARHGVAGVLPGNTAERLLTTIDCSLLVVKPDDFVRPLPLSSNE
jgi:nucleotide-binding universal stress UspA family protein